MPNMEKQYGPQDGQNLSCDVDLDHSVIAFRIYVRLGYASFGT